MLNVLCALVKASRESVLIELCKAHRGGPDKQGGSYIFNQGRFLNPKNLKSSLDPDFCFVPSKGWASAGQLGIDLSFPVVLGSSPSENWLLFSFIHLLFFHSPSPGAGTTGDQLLVLWVGTRRLLMLENETSTQITSKWTQSAAVTVVFHCPFGFWVQDGRQCPQCSPGSWSLQREQWGEYLGPLLLG